MYNTSLQTSPCEKIVSFLPNSAIFLDRPADSRKFWALNVFLLLGFLPPVVRRIGALVATPEIPFPS
jgi:hypothetical protein